MADFFDDLIPQQAATLDGFDDLIPKSQFANVQSGAATAAVPEKAWYEKAGTALAEIPEAAYEGLQAGGSELGKWATLAASTPAMAYDAAKSALSGEATTEAQDWMFGNLVEPQDQAAQYNRNEIAKKGVLGQVAGGVGQAVPDVALAMAGGSTLSVARAAAPLVEAGASGLKQMLAESINVGVKTAAPLAEKAAAQRYGEAIAQGKSQGEATGEAIKAIATTTAMGLTGSGGVGRLGNTVASGLGGEVVREMEGRPFDPAELGVNLALGAGLSGPRQEAPRAFNAEPTAADQRLLASSIELPLEAPPVAPRSPMEQRMAEFGLFSDLVPESTGRPLEALTSDARDTGATQVAPETEGAQNAVQSVLEPVAPDPLSPVAQRLKDANERSIQETGQPLSADEIRRIREEAPAQDEVLDLNPAELEAYQQWQRGQEETPEVSVDELSPADRALVERSMGAPDEAVSFLREESARQGDLDAEQGGLKAAVKSTLGDTEVTFLRDEDGLPPDVKTKPKADGTVRKGLYDPRTGKVYLFTGSGMTPQDAAFTAAHEIAGHKGLRSLAASEAKIGTKTAREWLDTSLSNALENPTVKAVADSMAAQRKSGDTILMAEEAMADLAAAVRTGDWTKLEAKHGVTVPEGVRAGVKGVVQKFVEQIRRLVNVTISKATGKKAKFTDAQVNELIENAWQAAKSGEEARTAESALEQSGAQTDTPAFRKWFGESKVVDESGSPKVLYHGTREQFDTFDPSKLGSSTGNSGFFGSGLYFTNSESIASGYGGGWGNATGAQGAKIMRVHLAIKNPLQLTEAEPSYKRSLATSRNRLLKLKGWTEEELALLKSRDLDFISDFTSRIGGERFREVVEANGFDGVHVRGSYGSMNADEWVAFRPEQVKSATDNRGTFDPNNPNILYSDEASGPAPRSNATPEEKVTSEAFRKWFGKSKVVDGEGKPLRVFHGTERQFDTFSPSSAPGFGRGMYFTNNREQAQTEYAGPNGRVVEAFVSIKNPSDGGFPGYDVVESTKAWAEASKQWEDPIDAWNEDGSFAGDVLRELGYDGIIAKNSNDIDGLEIVAFDPKQIKSATGNRGTFDPNDPNILYSDEGSTPRSNATPDSNIVPEWQRRLKSVFSWKGGNRFANEYERAALEAATGDFLAERSAKLFDKAGFKKLSDNQKEMVRAALNGDKSAEAALPEKARNAVRFTRDEITNYQSKLASQGVKMDGVDLSDMLYDSMAKDNYTTRAYGVYEIKPTTIDRIAYAASRAESRGVPFWRWRQERKNPEAVQSVTRYIEENLIDPSSKRTPQEQTEDILNQLADPRGFTGSNLEVVRQAARDSSILMARDNVPAPIREYWGEFKDPRLQAAMTLSRLGALTAKQTMLTNIWKANAGKLFFEDGQQPKGFTAKLPDNHDYGPLAGKMTRPDIARQIETMTGIEKATPGKTEAEIGKALWNSYVQVASGAKVAKTVFSAATSAVNTMANTFLMGKVAVQQGLMGRSLGALEFVKTMNTVFRDFLGNLDAKSAKKYIELGIIRDSAQYGELRKIRSKYQREADRIGEGTGAKAVHAVTDAVAKTFGKTADLYQIPDNAARLYFFLGEMAIQRKLHPDWTQAQVENEAANRARDQVPTWGRAAPAVKFTSRAAGNFATWSAEVIRSTKNQVKYALNDIVHGETPAQKYYGLTQLVGTASYMAAAQVAVPTVINALFGFKTDDEKKNEAVSRIAPEYFGGDTLAVASADPKSGKIVFLNSTRLDPSAPFHQLWNREMQALKDDKSIPEATWGWIKDAFLTPGPLPSGGAAAVTGENKFGQKLAPDERMKAVVDAFKPGTLVTAAKIDKLKKRGVDPRVIQAAQTGLPLYDFDASRAMYFSAMDFNNALREYRQQFNRGFGAAEATPEQQQAKYKEFLRNEKETFDKINNQVKALQTIFGDKEGKKIAMDAIEGAKIDKDYKAALVEGTFKPNNLEDSKTFLDTQEKNAIYADPKREKEIRKDFAERRRKLTQMRRNYQQLLNND